MESNQKAAVSTKKISLRTATASDNEFLIHVYASTREEEMAAGGWSAA